MYTSFLGNFKNLLIDNCFLERESLFIKSEEEIDFLDSKLMDGCGSNLKKKIVEQLCNKQYSPLFFRKRLRGIQSSRSRPLDGNCRG